MIAGGTRFNMSLVNYMRSLVIIKYSPINTHTMSPLHVVSVSPIKRLYSLHGGW